MERCCIIISGGTFSDIPELLPEDAYVIACDRGWEYAERSGLQPDLCIGDFDSSAAPENPRFPILCYPPEKDDTDTMLAIRYALKAGYQHIILLYAMGGRFDHEFANIQAAAFAAEAGAITEIWSEREIITVFAENTLRLKRRPGWSLSVFALDTKCTGVSIKGAKYEVEQEELTCRFPIGASNAWDSEETSISVQSGILMVVESRLQPGEHN